MAVTHYIPCKVLLYGSNIIPYKVLLYGSNIIPYKVLVYGSNIIPYKVLVYGRNIIPYKVLVYGRTLYIPYRILSMATTLYILYSWYDIRFSRRWPTALSSEIKRRVVWHKPAFREQPVAYIFTLEVSSPKQIGVTFTPHGR